VGENLLTTHPSTGEVTAKKPGAVTITATPAQAMSGAAPIHISGGGGMDISVSVAADSVAATGVTLNKSAVSLTVGNTETLMPTVQPSDATNQAVNWTSSDASVAVVSSGGTVTALSPGTAAVAVATVDGGRVAAYTITVADAPAEPVHPTSVSLDRTALEMWGTALLAPTVLPLNADNRNVYWLTSNPAVAVVSSLGRVTGVVPGTATVTVVTVDGGRAATCAVTVVGAPIAVTGVTLNKNYMGLGLGGGERLLETVLPENATNRDVTWASNAPGVATVSNGIVTGVSLGTATITVTTVDGGHTAACTVTVAENNYVQATGVALDRAQLALDAGAAVTLIATVLPEDASNKAVTWTSSAPGVATVSADGQVAAWANGAATIIVTTADGGFVATCSVTVTTRVADVTISPTVLSMCMHTAGAWLTAQLLPNTATNRAVTFTSNNPAVVSVTSVAGLMVNINAVAVGSARITVRTNDGGFEAYCDVTVTNPPPQKIYVGGQFGLLIDGVAQSAYDGCTVLAVEVINGVVHACGVTNDRAAPKAVLWVNGIRSYLPMTAGATVSGAHGICAVGSDVYIAGWDAPNTGASGVRWDPFQFRLPDASKARLWKNGAIKAFDYPHNTANTITHVGSYGLCLAVADEVLGMGGGLEMSDGFKGAAVWAVDPDYATSYIEMNFAFLPQPHKVFYVWSIAGEPPPAKRLWAASPDYPLICCIDLDTSTITQPYGNFAAISVKYLNNTLYAAGYHDSAPYPPAYLVDGAIYGLDCSVSSGLYSEAWDINLGPGGVIHACGGEFDGTNFGGFIFIDKVSPRLWQGTTEQVVPGWTSNTNKGMAYAVAADAP
jgi:uncharacterized protein YjdB